MNPSSSPVTTFFKGVVKYPKTVLMGLLLLTIWAGFQARHFRLDASSETLLLKNDPDLLFARKISHRYGTHDFLVLTYTPQQDLFSQPVLDDLTRLKQELESVPGVASVTSILDVPLLQSPPVPLKEVTSHIHHLSDPNTDRALARAEFQHSPLYRDLLVSPDLKTTALLVNFPDDPRYRQLRQARNDLDDKRSTVGLSSEEELALKQAQTAFDRYHDQVRQKRHQELLDIRAIMGRHRARARLFLGGVSMIADDMITFIRNDIRLFGIGVSLFLMLTLGLIFRAWRWVFLPLLVCVISVFTMMGLLGALDWEVTVISSNFISLQLIITMAIAIHLIVRYRELATARPDAEKSTLIVETMRLKLKPCLYAMLTTVAGFASLILCNIRPVMSFGWMMITGLVISLILTFLLFPSLLVLLPRESVPTSKPWRFSLTDGLARFTEKHGRFIVTIGGLALVFSLMGISRLKVENSFINYFKKSTEIYQGMKVIDKKFGGTTPLDVIVNFDTPKASQPAQVSAEPNLSANDEALFNEFDESTKTRDTNQTTDAATYWYTPYKMKIARKVDAYLESLPQIGKVLSLATTLKLTDKLNHGRPLDGVELALLFKDAPQSVQDLLVRPYVSVAHNQMRFSVRIIDSDPTLRRNAFIHKIQHDLVQKVGLKPGSFRLSGMLILYNNMLQSLFSSQIKTLGLTILALSIMFLILFRSVKIALIAMAPNLLSVGVVLGVMGWFGIPLDMMTITIAAISVGIAVDDTIHYIHRFQNEYHQDHDYLQTMLRCHHSIGHAMYYTSVTIIIGFSILGLSNFIPSILFGLLTSLAMLIALIAALTLLPQLLMMGRPFD